MFKFIANIFAAQRNAAALLAAMDELHAVEAKTKSIISHATGGAFSDLDASLNDICVEISKSKNHVYHEARKMEREALAGDLLHSMHDAERRVLVLLHDEVGRKLADIAEEARLTVDEVRIIAKGFVIKGLAYFCPLFDMDSGTPKGSGYLLSPEGNELKARQLAANVADSAAKARALAA
jgi:hypothetical protein